MDEGGADVAGGDDFETLPVGESPVDKTTSIQNRIVVKGNVGTLSPLFKETQYG